MKALPMTDSPPNKGPITLETAKTLPNIAKMIGRCCNVVTLAMIENADTKMPAAPTPERARPKIRRLMLGETVVETISRFLQTG